MTDSLVWIDCEMTGLDFESDALIEVACLITDGELNILDEGVDVVIRPPQDALDRMGDFVRDMHTTSGLLEQLDKGVSLQEAEDMVLEHIHQYVTEPRKAPLCGNSISTDRTFLARDMKRIDEFLHYRMVDVSSIKELLRRWYPRVYYASPEKNGGHRALADITESIRELRYYRAAAFVPPPGPSSSTARAIAADVAAGGTGTEAREEASGNGTAEN
ncbi:MULTISPECIES: oligoribonuclease [Nocardiopsis]|jgi:oligoribonuclease|uniref:Oligoribonuclease n=2 Tax=Nocardiopsis sinuspersici TaxID=501010 RepID=A0A7Y9XGF6_9ACTN|nr:MULTISPECIES: oligoribonuclease [Nocardiopsis]NYH54043.1 oligoribonuclease [Nocardiopsis sinuspersici]